MSWFSGLSINQGAITQLLCIHSFNIRFDSGPVGAQFFLPDLCRLRLVKEFCGGRIWVLGHESRPLRSGWIPFLDVHAAWGPALEMIGPDDQVDCGSKGEEEKWSQTWEKGFWWAFEEATKGRTRFGGQKIIVLDIQNLKYLHDIYVQMDNQNWTFREKFGRCLGGQWGRKKWIEGNLNGDHYLSPLKVSCWSQIHHLRGWIVSPPTPPVPARKEWNTQSA